MPSVQHVNTSSMKLTEFVHTPCFGPLWPLSFGLLAAVLLKSCVVAFSARPASNTNIKKLAKHRREACTCGRPSQPEGSCSSRVPRGLIPFASNWKGRLTNSNTKRISWQHSFLGSKHYDPAGRGTRWYASSSKATCSSSSSSCTVKAKNYQFVESAHSWQLLLGTQKHHRRVPAPHGPCTCRSIRSSIKTVVGTALAPTFLRVFISFARPSSDHRHLPSCTPATPRTTRLPSPRRSDLGAESMLETG